MSDDDALDRLAAPAPWLIPPPALVSDDEIAERARLEAETRIRAFEKTLPKAYAWARFDAPELAERVTSASGDAIQKAKFLVTSPRVVLVGPPGSGKTSLGVAMLRAWYASTSRSARFVHAHRLGIARIQHHAGSGEASEVDVAMRAEMVLLDDVGGERITATNALPDVVYERHAEGRALWATTALTMDQLTERYGGGIARRLFEGATVIRLGRR